MPGATGTEPHIARDPRAMMESRLEPTRSRCKGEAISMATAFWLRFLRIDLRCRPRMANDERASLVDESLPLEAGGTADACAAVPSPSGYRAMLQALFRGKLTGAAIALIIRQVIVMGLGVGSSVAVSRWLGPEVVGRFAILIFVTQGILGYFGDLGLKAALIRKRGDLEPTELATAQTSDPRNFADVRDRDWRSVAAGLPTGEAGPGELLAGRDLSVAAGGAQPADRAARHAGARHAIQGGQRRRSGREPDLYRFC